jgi:hypothetical protein
LETTDTGRSGRFECHLVNQNNSLVLEETISELLFQASELSKQGQLSVAISRPCYESFEPALLPLLTKHHQSIFELVILSYVSTDTIGNIESFFKHLLELPLLRKLHIECGQDLDSFEKVSKSLDSFPLLEYLSIPRLDQSTSSAETMSLVFHHFVEKLLCLKNLTTFIFSTIPSMLEERTCKLFLEFIENEPNLTVLKLNFSKCHNLANACLEKMALKAHSTFVDITNPDLESSFNDVERSNLKNLYMRFPYTAVASKNLKFLQEHGNLEVLSIKSVIIKTPELIDAIFLSFPNLTSLSLDGCVLLDDAFSMKDSIARLPNLSHLSMMGVSKTGFEAAKEIVTAISENEIKLISFHFSVSHHYYSNVLDRKTSL